MLQNLIHHKLFYSCASTSDSSPHSIRPHIISFLYLLFHMQPTNTCQLSHITPLMRIYHGTLAPPDRNILSILSLFEVHRGLSTASIFRQWSSQPLSSSTNITEAVLTLDSSIVFRTCTSLPTRVPREGPASSIAEDEAALYDPLFLVLLLGAMLEDSPPSTGLDWVQVFRTNIVSLAICTAASKDPQARQVALLVLSGVINGIKVSLL
jgi:nucleolar pre-ribosomal-associated protein 1